MIYYQLEYKIKNKNVLKKITLVAGTFSTTFLYWMLSLGSTTT